MIVKSIRWRLQAWHGLILVIVLAGFGFTAYEVARENQLRRIDQGLEERVTRLLFRPGPRPDNGLPPKPPDGGPGGPGREHGEGGPGHDGPGPGHDEGGPPDRDFWRAQLCERIKQADSLDADQAGAVYFILWDRAGSLLASSTNTPPSVPKPESTRPSDRSGFRGPPGPGPGFGMSTARSRAEFRELVKDMPSGDLLVVGRSIAVDRRAMRQLALWLFAAGAAVLALGLAGGWWVASRAIRPIEAISATAGKIAAGDLSQRINVADTESELGRLAGVLNSTFARLEAAFANQSRFTSDASHELRTPVSVILVQTQTALSRERPAAEYRAALEACQRSAKRMRTLAESLLELARLDDGQEGMKRERFDLGRVARECVDMIRPLATERNLTLHCDLPVVECTGEAERIGRVITNLLTNAVHFNRDRGEIRVTVRAEGNTALIVVSDAGEGISAEDLPHIFERFYRADKARSGIQGRTGLGLAICQAIIEASGGTIETASHPGEGSTFTVKLPRE